MILRPHIRTALALLLLLAMPPGRAALGPPPAAEDGVSSVSIVTDNGYTPDQLVREVFARGACENIFNVAPKGNSAGIGYFENGTNAIGLDRGIILATGPIHHAHGPNQVTDRSGNFNDNSGDADLNVLAGANVRDVVGLSFDFIPLDSFITFRYVFASEEYCEFVGTVYNDVFGFFISGPGISGGFSGNARNVALVPGSQDFVSINTVNHLQNAPHYRRNLRQEEAASCGVPHQPSANALRIEYDGFTTPLTATLKLDPCASYHIRFMVADVGDNFYDSAVFLEAGSFNLGGAVQLTALSNEVYEGCSSAFRFSREAEASTQHPLTVHYKVTASSTATPSLDFSPLPGVITIPAGKQYADLPLHTLNDDLPEPPETVVLELDIPCACYTDSASITIIDAPPIALVLPPIVLCQGGDALVSPAVSGGVPPYTYLWSGGQQGPVLTATDNGTTTYGLTVTDACGNTATASSDVTLSTPPSAHLSGAAEICEGDTAHLLVQCTGIAPWRIAYSVDGVPQPAMEGILTPNYMLPATLAGTYTLDMMADAGCAGIPTGTAEVQVMAMTVEVQRTHPACHDSHDGHIQVSVGGGTPPYQIAWAHTPGSDTALANLPAGEYTLQLTDAQACQKSVPITLLAPPPLGPVEVDCATLRQPPLSLSATGGTPPYVYATDGGPLLPPTLFDTLPPGHTYPLRIQDAAGCELTQPFLMPLAYQDMVALPATVEIKLGATHLLPCDLLIPEHLLSAVRWLPETNLDCANCLAPTHTALYSETYTVRLFDVFGCSEVKSIRIEVDPDIDVFAPTVFSPNGDEVNDVFVVLINPVQVSEVVLFQVFDRWGGLVFATRHTPPNDPAHGWDGTRRGRPMPVGAYAYMVVLRLADGSQKVVAGDVVLMR